MKIISFNPINYDCSIDGLLLKNQTIKEGLISSFSLLQLCKINQFEIVGNEISTAKSIFKLWISWNVLQLKWIPIIGI